MATNAAARERLTGLLATPDAGTDVSGGFLDLLGPAEQAEQSTGIAQRLMRMRLVSTVYERYWRPALGMVAKGITGPSMAGEIDTARELLRLRTGSTVLDVACGTGAFTRAFGRTVGDSGLAIGLDGSLTMLAKAVAATGAAEPVAFVRADAVRPPLREATVEAVCCFAALHLFADPEAALDSFRKVLEPGGRLAVLTSARHGGQPLRTAETLLGAGTGMRMFDREELTTLLHDRGFTELSVEYAGATQLVAATRP